MLAPFFIGAIPQLSLLVFSALLSAPVSAKLEEKLKDNTIWNALKGVFRLAWYIITCFWAILKIAGGCFVALFVSRWALAGAILIFAGVLLALFVTSWLASLPFVGTKAVLLNLALIVGGGLTFAYGYQTEYMAKQGTREIRKVEQEVAQLRTRLDKAPGTAALEQIDRLSGSQLAKKWAAYQKST